MPSEPARLSKSRYLSGLQCHKQLWWRVHEPEAPELSPSPGEQNLFAQGREVGEHARAHVPGGELIDLPYYQYDNKVTATREALNRDLPAIYEAWFLADETYVGVDILERASRGLHGERGEGIEQPQPGAFAGRDGPGACVAACGPSGGAGRADASQFAMPLPRLLQPVRARRRHRAGRGGADRRAGRARGTTEDARRAVARRGHRRALHDASRLSIHRALLAQAPRPPCEQAVPHRAEAGARARGRWVCDDLRPALGPGAVGDPRAPGAGGADGADAGGADAHEGAGPVRVTARVSRFRDRKPRDPGLAGVPAVAAGAGAVQRACGARGRIGASWVDCGRAGGSTPRAGGGTGGGVRGGTQDRSLPRELRARVQQAAAGGRATLGQGARAH